MAALGIIVAGLSGTGVSDTLADDSTVSRSVVSGKVEDVLVRIREHDFEGNSGYEGVGDLNDDGWRVRTLAIRDLVRLGGQGASGLRAGLKDESRHVRHVCVMVLGILGVQEAAPELQRLLAEEPDPIVRGQAAQALGQLGQAEAESILSKVAKEDKSRHVRHRARLAIRRLQQGEKTNAEVIATWAGIDEKTFRLAKVGEPAPDFELADTNGKTRRLSDFKKKQSVVLIWIFADWCPVCQREFHDLRRLEGRFKAADVAVFTIECHDRFRCKVMAREREQWWPHLVDLGGKVGAMYGVDPLEFIVHDEWINRPTTIIIDRQGVVRFAYYGTYWGDRPTIEETIKMIESEKFSFRHPKRRE